MSVKPMMKTAAVPVIPRLVPAAGAATPPPATSRRERVVQAIADIARVVVPPLLGFLALLLVWSLVAGTSGIPGPDVTWDAAVKLFSEPFHTRGPNDQGIG